MMKLSLLLLLCLVAGCVRAEEDEQPSKSTDDSSSPGQPSFSPPARPPGDVYFFESFSDEDDFEKNWVRSKVTKDDDTIKYNGGWKLGNPSFVGAVKEDVGLLMPEANRLYAISRKLERTFDFSENDQFTVQFEVNFQEGLNCGGAYVKLLVADQDLDLTQFKDNTPYSIMFGPDRCGQTSKIHFIVRFKNPRTGEIEEKHGKPSTDSFDFFNDRLTHLFLLFLRNDDYYSISVDEKVVASGYLTSDLSPSIVPPQQIDDPSDKKPSDWDDKEKISDPEAVKPDDWDEDAPRMIPDPDAVKPEGWLDDTPETFPDPDASRPDDWDDDVDGEWEPPMIRNPACAEVGCGEWKRPQINNPAYKGKWKAPLIDNSNYMGVWAPRKIDNPAYFELDGTAYSQLLPISALGFELWTVGQGILFDNILVSSEITSATALAKETWIFKHEREQKATGTVAAVTSWVDYFIDVANDRPYLWAFYAILLVLPFVLCAACCVKSSKPSDEAGRRKKTDEPTPDDKPQGERKKKSNEESFIAPAEDEEEEPDSKDTDKEKEEITQKQQEPDEGGARQRKGKKGKQQQQPSENGLEQPSTEKQKQEEDGAGNEGDDEFTAVRKSPRRGGNRKPKRED